MLIRILYSFLLLVILQSCSQDDNSTPKSYSKNVSLTEGTNVALALSPDKKTLAFDLQGTIWILDVEGGQATALTDYLGDCHEPSWSPDGEKIIFHSYRDGNYHLWSVDKTKILKQHTSGSFDNREPFWGSDGAIYFSSDRSGTYDIWRLFEDEITQITADHTDEYFPSLSSNNNSLIYVINHGNRHAIQSLDLLSGQSLQLYESKNSLYSPTYNRDNSTWIAVEIGNSASRIIHGNGSNFKGFVTDETEEVFPFKAGWLDNDKFYVTANGKIKLKEIGSSEGEIIPFEASVLLSRTPYLRKKYILDDTLATNVKGILSPTLSPDGNKIVFAAKGNLWIHEVVKNATYQITQDKYMQLEPAWYSGGDQLIYIGDRRGKMEVWRYDLNSNKSDLLYSGEGSMAYPVLSPDDGQLAVFVRDRENIWARGQLIIVDLATKVEKEIEGSYFAPSKISWSPDGTKLVMMALTPVSGRFREGVSQVYVFDLITEERFSFSPKQYTSVAMRNSNGPIWMPDGKSIAYIQGGQLHAIPVDINGMPIGDSKILVDDMASVPSVSKDGNTMVFQSMDKLKYLNLDNNSIKDIDIELTTSTSVNSKEYAVHVGKLFDGIKQTYRQNVDIVVNGSKIVNIEPHKDNRSIEMVDASSLTAIPALIESHTHQHAAVGEKLGRTWLAYGITTVREPGTNPYDALYRKETWQDKEYIGPRVFFTGGLTDGSRIYYDIANSIVDNDHLELELQRAKALDYDLIKTYVRLEDSIQKIITERAHAIGIPVSSHEIYPSTSYNVDGVEHIRGTSRRGYSLKQTYLNNTYSDVINLLAQSQMHITPTIALQGGYYVMLNRYPELLAHTQLAHFYGKEYINGLGERMSSILQIRPGYLTDFDPITKSIKKIADAGGWILAGTDSPFIPYGFSLQIEIQLFVELGMTPYEAIRCATIHAAKALNIHDQLGSLEKNKIADFVLINGDPLSNIKDMLNVEATYKNGIRYDIEKLMQ